MSDRDAHPVNEDIRLEKPERKAHRRHTGISLSLRHKSHSKSDQALLTISELARELGLALIYYAIGKRIFLICGLCSVRVTVVTIAQMMSLWRAVSIIF